MSDHLTRSSFLTVVASLTGRNRGRLIEGGVNAEPLPKLATSAEVEAAVRRITARIDAIPADATDPELAQLVADRLDQIITAIDGLTLDDGTVATGADARQLLLELLGAAA